MGADEVEKEERSARTQNLEDTRILAVGNDKYTGRLRIPLRYGKVNNSLEAELLKNVKG